MIENKLDCELVQVSYNYKCPTFTWMDGTGALLYRRRTGKLNTISIRASLVKIYSASILLL